ncbi:MAG: hypothetical protein U0232_30030 [Thermomicrobiales bacterium]
MDGVLRRCCRSGASAPAPTSWCPAYDSDADILRAVEARATGYLLKDAPRDDLFRAIAAASPARWCWPRRRRARLLGRMRRPAEALSAREVEVLRLVARGAAQPESPAPSTSARPLSNHLLHLPGQTRRRRPHRRRHRRAGAGDIAVG